VLLISFKELGMGSDKLDFNQLGKSWFESAVLLREKRKRGEVGDRPASYPSELEFSCVS